MADNLIDLSKRAATGDNVRTVAAKLAAISRRMAEVAAEAAVVRNEIAADPGVFTAADRAVAKAAVEAAYTDVLVSVYQNSLLTGVLVITVDGTPVA